MSLLLVSEAADRLDVVPRRVQHFVASRDLSSMARDFVVGPSADHLI